ncbi:hypothetical protein [Dyadobacter aurulentus]|uniref:hypothetical protein n=1 Tax=Dyadobacter sp. UC 10 TaxID=2605428 RepID=UPI0011F179BA|nr:hypothetical protein [Dyadobacter sp. UC 10]KAA0990991.1 hypothetical protein FXO21_12915 [Dyadobacter sp. UC 10]
MEVKERIVSQINQIDDEALLSELELILVNLVSDSQVPYRLTDQMKASIDLGEADFREGRTAEHNHLMNEMKEWLKER